MRLVNLIAIPLAAFVAVMPSFALEHDNPTAPFSLKDIKLGLSTLESVQARQDLSFNAPAGYHDQYDRDGVPTSKFILATDCSLFPLGKVTLSSIEFIFYQKPDRSMVLYRIMGDFRPEDRDELLDYFLLHFGKEDVHGLTCDVVKWRNDVSEVYMTSPNWIDRRSKIKAYKARMGGDERSWFLITLDPPPVSKNLDLREKTY